MKEIITSGIKRLIIDETITLNRQGAIGWIYKDCIWLHSKRFLYDLKKIDELPKDDEDIKELMFDFGLIVKNNNNRLLHRKEVITDECAIKLSLLCLPLRNVWRNPDDYPPQMKGITVRDIS